MDRRDGKETTCLAIDELDSGHTHRLTQFSADWTREATLIGSNLSAAPMAVNLMDAVVIDSSF